jgi:glutathione S-transferase
MKRTLYHLPLSPACREIRLMLAEKKLEAMLIGEGNWPDGDEFLRMNPAGTVPVLTEEDGTAIAERDPIVEYLEEAYPMPPLLPSGAKPRAEIRRLAAWFDGKFAQEVSQPILFERVDKRQLRLGSPDMNVVRTALERLSDHLGYIGSLCEARKWLGGDELSVADLTAAAHLSCLDYLGDVPWRLYEGAKDWYVRLKSRPSFRPLLSDRVAGMPPPRHYADLDF